MGEQRKKPALDLSRPVPAEPLSRATAGSKLGGPFHTGLLLQLQRLAGNASVTSLVRGKPRLPAPRAGLIPTVQRDTEKGNLQQLDEMLDKFNVPEDDVIALLGRIAATEKTTVVGSYKRRIAKALNVGEMVRAVTNLGPNLATKLEWVEAAAATTTMINYNEVRKLVTDAPAEEKDGLKNARWKSFFVSVCDNATMKTAMGDFGFDLVTRLEWLEAEMTSVTAELNYGDIRKWVTDAPEDQKQAVKTDKWRAFFVKVCTNATMKELVKDLGLNLVDKLTWLRTEMTSVTAEMSYADVRELIVDADDGQRQALKNATWRAFFVDLCTNATMFEAVRDLGWDLPTKLDWIRAEMTSVRAELDFGRLRDLVTTASPEDREALKTKEWRSFFGDVCTAETMVELVEILFTTLRDKLWWMATESVEWPVVRHQIEATTDAGQRTALYAEAGLRDFFVSMCDNTTMADAVVLLGGGFRDQKRPWLDAEGTSISQYLDAIIRAGTIAPGGAVAHTAPVDADKAIADHLGSLVAGASGGPITGHVAIVDWDDWDVAGIEHYGDVKWASEKRNSINGFMDGEGRVWINKDNGDVGTMIHEGLHRHSNQDLLGISQPLNEGVTEYFTRKVCAALTPPFTGRTAYAGNFSTATQLVTLVGEGTVSNAYFQGATSALEDAFKRAKGKAAWQQFVSATKLRDWVTATSLAT